jgi:hypothetical protein
MRRIILLLALSLAFCFVADAKLPEVGDYVRISFSTDTNESISYEGNVSDIGDGLICLNCSLVAVTHKYSGVEVPLEAVYPFDVCIGTGQIVMLAWLEPEPDDGQFPMLEQ